MYRGADGRFGEHGEEVAKIFLKFLELTGIDAGWGAVDGQGELGFPLLQFAFEDLAGTGDGVALVVEKALDTHGPSRRRGDGKDAGRCHLCGALAGETRLSQNRRT